MNLKSKIGGHQAILNKYRTTYLKLGLLSALSRQLESLADFKIRSGQRVEGIKLYLEALQYTRKNKRVWIKLIAGAVLGKFPLEMRLKKRARNTQTIVVK